MRQSPSLVEFYSYAGDKVTSHSSEDLVRLYLDKDQSYWCLRHEKNTRLKSAFYVSTLRFTPSQAVDLQAIVQQEMQRSGMFPLRRAAIELYESQRKRDSQGNTFKLRHSVGYDIRGRPRFIHAYNHFSDRVTDDRIRVMKRRALKIDLYLTGDRFQD